MRAQRLRRRLAEWLNPPRYIHTAVDERGCAVLTDTYGSIYHEGTYERCAACFFGKGIKR